MNDGRRHLLRVRRILATPPAAESSDRLECPVEDYRGSGIFFSGTIWVHG